MKGIIGRKVGMTQIFTENGDVIPVTVIKAGPCYVTQLRTPENDGYRAVQLGFEELPPRRNGSSRLKQPQQGHLRRKELRDKGIELPDLRVLREFRLTEDEQNGLEEGQTITVDAFEVGDLVDIIGTSKGRGFAGTVKRHNFNRQPKTHGQSDRERAPGSVGASAFPGRTFKGTRMAGRMGNERVTVQNLVVQVVDPEHNLLAVRGSVPGARGGLVLIKAAKKSRQRQK
ncbi:MAG: 50S ribosomal protein L3 [Phototrophicales bacterium]|nr:MAG: 50S ribosomal protein L3 [Phototrophicales bacterium]